LANIFAKIFDALAGSNKPLLSAQLLAEAEKLWIVQEGNWTTELKRQFTEDLKCWLKNKTAASPEKKTFFEKLEEDQKAQADEPPPPPPAAKEVRMLTYRAKVDCVVQGWFRRKGDIFSAFETDNPHIELMSEGGIN